MSDNFPTQNYNKGLAAVELAIIVSVFLLAAILFGSLFTKIRVADRENEYLYTFNSLPNPNVYQYGVEGELQPKTDADIQMALDEMHERVKFGTRGGDSCIAAYKLRMNTATHVSGCDTAIITGADSPVYTKGTCNCIPSTPPSPYEQYILSARNPECFDEQIIFLAHMAATSPSDSECKVFQVFPGSTKKFATPFIPIY